MNTRLNCLALSILVLLFVSSPAIAQAPPMPTMEDLQKMYDAGQYRTCLQQIARVLYPASAAPGGYDRYALLLMRADCLLHLGDNAIARQTYQLAEQSPDEAEWARARAMAFLIARSPGLRYTPLAGGEPLDISVDANQKQAMQELLADQMKVVQGDVRRAMTAQNLEPILEFVPRLQDLYALEYAATGQVEKTQPIVQEVEQHARDLIQREINQIAQRLQSIRSSSAQSAGASPVQEGGAWWMDPNIVRRGLFPEERQWLQDTVGYAAQIQRTAERGQKLSARLGDQSDQWNQLVTETEQLQQNAQEILQME